MFPDRKGTWLVILLALVLFTAFLWTHPDQIGPPAPSPSHTERTVNGQK